MRIAATWNPPDKNDDQPHVMAQIVNMSPDPLLEVSVEWGKSEADDGEPVHSVQALIDGLHGYEPDKVMSCPPWRQHLHFERLGDLSVGLSSPSACALQIGTSISGS